MRHMYKGSASNTMVFDYEGKGGYYYAFSKELSTKTYTEVFANIVLPTRFNRTAAVPRNAYIAFGIRAKNGYGVDLGLANTGRGWYPCYFDTLGIYDDFPDYVAPSNATNAGIVVKPIDEKHVHMYIQFQDINGKNVGKTFDQTISVETRPGGWNRYYRFASMIVGENDPNNVSDETYMVGGKFTNMGIYNGNTYIPWGITGSSSLCEVAWSEEFPKAQVLNSTAHGEEFRIDHWA